MSSNPLQILLSNAAFNQFNGDQLLATYATLPSMSVSSGSASINSNTIDCIPPEGITLDQPGDYVFSRNIVWKPTTQAIAITITASNVTLDLKGFELKDKGKCKDRQTIGISLQSVNNVTITNGSIVGMHYYGVQALSSTQITISHILVDGITLSDTNTRFLTPAGLFVNSCQTIVIDNVKVKHIEVTTDSSAGIQLFECANATVSNCQVSEMVNHDGAVQGFSYILSVDITTTYCRSNKLRSYFHGNTLTTGHTVLGFCPVVIC